LFIFSNLNRLNVTRMMKVDYKALDQDLVIQPKMLNDIEIHLFAEAITGIGPKT
jgi:hypothetical protein